MSGWSYYPSDHGPTIRQAMKDAEADARRERNAIKRGPALWYGPERGWERFDPRLNVRAA